MKKLTLKQLKAIIKEIRWNEAAGLITKEDADYDVKAIQEEYELQQESK